MNPSPSILVFGTDRDLIETRRLVLEHSGFDVILASSVEQTTAILSSRRFDLLIVCHSVSYARCEDALSEAHRLILHRSLSRRAAAEQHAHLSAFSSPETLIATARELTVPSFHLQKGQDRCIQAP